MEKLNIAVIFGGYSNEHEVSQGSGKTVMENLDSNKYNIIPLYICEKGLWYLFKGDDYTNVDTSVLPRVVFSSERTKELIISGEGVRNIDLAFPALLGKFGEDGTIQGLFEMAGIPYTGCGVLSSSLCMEKVFSNDFVKLLNIPQPKYLAFRQNDKIDKELIVNAVGLPCFVKPVRSGSSVGIVIAKTSDELDDAITTAFSYDSRIIIEENIRGRELKCAVLGTGGDDTEASVPGETVYEGVDFYDYDAKYKSSATKKFIPADVSDEVVKEVQELSLKIFKALDCSGLARIDFFLEESSGRILFNEINTFPAFTGVSMYPSLCKHMGYPTDKLLDRLIEIGLNTVR